MIQNDTLDSSDVNKLNTPALERLFIEMSNASTTLMNNYVGYDIPANGSVTNLGELGNGSNNSIPDDITNGNSNINCSYGSINQSLDYPGSHEIANTNDDNNIQQQQQLNPVPSHHHHNHHQPHHNHHHHHHPSVNQHVTNPVFHNDPILTESLPGNIDHRPSRASEYINPSGNSHNSQNNGENIRGYQLPDSLTNHSLSQPIASSTPMSMSPSPVTLTTLSSTSTPISSSVLPPMMPIKNEPDIMLNPNSNNNSSTNNAHNVANHSNGINRNVRSPASLTISPPVSPIDMEEQEKVKLERKRQRNRIAASKCRKRKLEKIHLLEKRVNELKDENEQLSTKVNKLRDHVCVLKREVIQHINSGCPISSPDHQENVIHSTPSNKGAKIIYQ